MVGSFSLCVQKNDRPHSLFPSSILVSWRLTIPRTPWKVWAEMLLFPRDKEAQSGCWAACRSALLARKAAVVIISVVVWVRELSLGLAAYGVIPAELTKSVSMDGIGNMQVVEMTKG